MEIRYFKYPDGNYIKDNWLKWNDKWYLFDSSGRMLTGWQKKNNYWYYLGENGDMKKGWLQSGNIWYYLNPNDGGPEGAMVTNSWLTINGKTYFVNASGIMVEGWYQIEGNYYYFYPEMVLRQSVPPSAVLYWMQTEYGSIKILLIYRIFQRERQMNGRSF